jgi:hypothetical protein
VGWNSAETGEIFGYHLRFIEESAQLSPGTRETLCKVGDWLRTKPSEDLMQQLDERGSLLYPCGPPTHAMQLLIQKRGEGYDVTLFNTGEGLRHHHSMGEKSQTYWGFEGVQLSDLDFLQEIEPAPSVDFVYERVRQLGGEAIPRAEDPKLLMPGQVKGVCAWTMNVALLRHQVMTQPGTVEDNYEQWKLAKALLDREILENHPVASLKGADIAEARVAKTGGDLLLAEMAADPAQFSEAVQLLGGENAPEVGRFGYLRELSNRLVDTWMGQYPAEPDFQPAFAPAALSYQHQRAMLKSFRREVEASYPLVTGDPMNRRFLNRYKHLVSIAAGSRYPDHYANELNGAFGHVPYFAIWPFAEDAESYQFALDDFQQVMADERLEMPVAEEADSIAGRFTHLRACAKLLADNWRPEFAERSGIAIMAAHALVKAPESGQ